MQSEQPRTPHAALAAIAASRHGVVRVDEAQDCGFTRAQIRTLIERGEWWRPRRGILICSATPDSWHQRAAVATLFTRGVLSHRASAFNHGLDGIRKAPIELLVPFSTNRPEGPWILHRADNLSAADVKVVNGIPTTTLARTIAEIGAVVDDDTVEQVMDSAMRMGLTDRKLQKTADRLYKKGSPASASLNRVLERPDRVGPLPDSRFERLVQRACRAGGLPEPQRQYPVRDANGRTIARLDMAWPEALLGAEADSRRFHSGITQVRSDNKRDLALMGLGWEICYVGWEQAADPATFTDALRSAYQLRAALHNHPTGR